jgi:hypothetical protein
MEQKIGMIQTEHETGFRLENQERKDGHSNQKANQLSRRHPVPSAIIQITH